MNAPTRLRSLLVTRLLVSAWLATLALLQALPSKVSVPKPRISVLPLSKNTSAHSRRNGVLL